MKGFGIYVKNDLLEPKHVENMGTSVWLYMWLLDKITSINENGVGKILGGRPINSAEVQEALGISDKTFRRWLATLDGCGYINTIRAPHGTIIYVNKAKKIFGKSSVKNAESSVKFVRSSVKSDRSIIDNTKTIQRQKGNYLKERQKATQIRELLADKGILKRKAPEK